eukprot:m.154075 g.154075  ORF g.154075 m.154075 type:complete len:388 (-) comp9785_c2_seq4:1642-2805(-)
MPFITLDDLMTARAIPASTAPLPPGFTHHVFLGHRWHADTHGRSGHQLALVIAVGLTRRGLRVFFDEIDLVEHSVKHGSELDSIERSCVYVGLVDASWLQRGASTDDTAISRLELKHATQSRTGNALIVPTDAASASNPDALTSLASPAVRVSTARFDCTAAGVTNIASWGAQLDRLASDVRLRVLGMSPGDVLPSIAAACGDTVQQRFEASATTPTTLQTVLEQELGPAGRTDASAQVLTLVISNLYPTYVFGSNSRESFLCLLLLWLRAADTSEFRLPISKDRPQDSVCVARRQCTLRYQGDLYALEPEAAAWDLRPCVDTRQAVFVTTGDGFLSRLRVRLAVMSSRVQVAILQRLPFSYEADLLTALIKLPPTRQCANLMTVMD